MFIRLLKTWHNDGKSWDAGQLLDVADESDAQRMIDAGVAEPYESGPQRKAAFNPNMAVSGSGDKVYCPQGIPAKQFWGYSSDGLDDGGFKHFADFCLAVKSGHDPRLSKLVTKDLAENLGSTGGFGVPTEFRNELITEMLANAHLLNRVLNIPMSTNSIEIPAIYDVDRSSTGQHGIDVPGADEAAALTDISPTFRNVQLKLSKIGGRCRVSNEMLSDSPLALSMLLPRIFAEAISFELIDQLINGSGVGQMLGILNAPALVTVAKESGQAADTIEFTNILKMWSRLSPAAKSNAIWIASPDTEVQLRSMTINVGTAGAAVFMVNVSENQPAKIFGRPLFFVEQCPVLGDAGDIICFNPRAYAMGRLQNDSIRIDVSEHARFENDQTVFRAIARTDGQPLQSSPITPKNGGDTLSNFVTLAERA